MKIADFFATHPVFRTEEFGAFLDSKGTTNDRTRDSHLRRYTLAGRLIRVRRPIYAVVPHGHEAAKFQIDPYLVASKLLPGAVIAYHAALQLQGHAHSVWSVYPVLTDRLSPKLDFQGYSVRSVPLPPRLRHKDLADLAIKKQDHLGLEIKVTILERTLVDCLDRPDLGGEWEEVWNSFAGVGYLNVDLVVDYALKFGKSITAAKTGYFLEQNRDRWNIEDRHLASLKKIAPKRLTYMDLHAKGRSTAVSAWNLMVPTAIQDRSWEEPA